MSGPVALSSAAREVSSFLVPHQSSEDLVQQGIPAREARRRSFFRTWLMERMTPFVEMILIWAILIPGLVFLSLGLTLFFAGVCDAIDGNSVAVNISVFLFGHLAEDHCDQPLGICVIIFWISIFSKLVMLTLWDRFHEIPAECCNGRVCRCLAKCFYYTLGTVTFCFELGWPLTTFSMLVLAKDCTEELKASTWVVLSPYILEAAGFFLYFAWVPCLKPFFWCVGILKDPANVVRSYERVHFDPNTFDDVTYAKDCPICLSDFCASDYIVMAPCSGRHVFHKACLGTWFRTSQTCPLCRTALNNPRAASDASATADMREALAA